MYSTGFAILPSLMFESSHKDSLSRFAVDSANRARQASDIAGTVLVHRSASPASTGLAGSGVAAPLSIGMKAGSRSRYFLPPSLSGVRLKSSRKWSSKKKTHTYQSVTRDSASDEQSGWVYAQSSA